jgi:hypothetical protein
MYARPIGRATWHILLRVSQPSVWVCGLHAFSFGNAGKEKMRTILAVAMVLVLAGCGNKQDTSTQKVSELEARVAALEKTTTLLKTNLGIVYDNVEGVYSNENTLKMKLNLAVDMVNTAEEESRLHWAYLQQTFVVKPDPNGDITTHKTACKLSSGETVYLPTAIVDNLYREATDRWPDWSSNDESRAKWTAYIDEWETKMAKGSLPPKQP